jgi:hypothetical protein
MSIDLGTTKTVSWALGTTGATVVLTVTNPAGATSTPTVTEASGTYSAPVPLTTPGQYQLRWTKAAAPAAAYTDVLNVWPSAPRYLLSLDDCRRAVKVTAADTTRDELLRLFNASGTLVIEDVAGKILPAAKVQDTDGGRPSINLWHRITEDTDLTVTVDGVALVEETGFIVDREAAIVHAGSRQFPSRFPAGRLNVRIEYSAGRATIPANIEQAAVELIRHQYQVGHQAVHAEWSADPSGDDTLDTTPSGYLIPRRVLQLCRPTPKLPSF